MPHVIDDLPESERPRERCLRQGARALSLRELIAVILGSGPRGVGCLGLAERVLERPGTGLPAAEEERAFFTALEGTGLAHLTAIPGLGESGQSRLLAAFELGRRYSLLQESQRQGRAIRPRLARVAEVALGRISDVLRAEPMEWLGFIPVYRSGQVGELCLVERGTRTHVNVDPTEIFARLLALRPAAFILSHNHPSGETRPSGPDYALTKEVWTQARAFGIELLGHWVVSARGEEWIDPGFL